jgi:hypothetical protein
MNEILNLKMRKYENYLIICKKYYKKSFLTSLR